MRRRASLDSVYLLVCLALTSFGCNLNNPGDDPPRGLLYFPTALALSAQTPSSAPRYLYLGNSNFDLRFNAGSIQAYDLDAIDRQILRLCSAEPSADCTIPVDDPSHPVLASERMIPSFVTAIAFSPDHSHLYLVSRTDSNLTYLDVDETATGDNVLTCGSTGRRCSDAYKRGDRLSNKRQLTFAPEPIAMTTGRIAELIDPAEVPPRAAASTDPGDFVMVAHRGGQVSLFLAAADANGKLAPILTDVLAGLPLELTGIAYDAATRRAYLSVWARTSATIDNKILSRVAVALNPDAPTQSLLYDDGTVDIDGVSYLRDTRALVFPSVLPGQALVLSHEPSALLWIDVPQTQTDSSESSSAAARRTVPVAPGPSRLTMGQVAGRSIVAVSSFDSRQLFVLDTLTGEPLSIIHNLSGPFEVAIDDARMRLYVADFRASVVRVVDLSPILTGPTSGPTSARIVATLGTVRLAQELQ